MGVLLPRFRINSMKAGFFDRKAVLEAVGRAKAAVMSKQGAFLSHTAKGLIRDGKKPSKPGKPPHSHTGILKRFLLFAYDSLQRSVVIGPAKTNQIFFDGDGKPVVGTVPELLEEGGSIQVLEWQVPGTGKWLRADLRFRRNRNDWKRRLRKVTVAARPYMGPALEKEKAKLPELWANSVKP